MLRSLSGLQAGDDVRDNSPGPEMIINREQERLYERKGAVLSLSVKFVASSHLIAALKPVQKKKRELHLTDRDGLIAASAFIGLTQEK